MEFWPEFLANSWGREFVAGGIGGMAGVVSGYPFDTIRVHLQQPSNTKSAFGLLCSIVSSQGPLALYRGMGAPFASVTFQNAMVFQVYAELSRALGASPNCNDAPSYKNVALAGVGTGALQSFLLSPVELVKIRLQLQTSQHLNNHQNHKPKGPVSVIKSIWKIEGIRGMYRGLVITVLRDAPAHGVYFSTYEYMREQLQKGIRNSDQESLTPMLVSGGLAGVASWVCSYPLDVIKSRLQAQSRSRWDNPPPRYMGILDCFRKSVKEEGYNVLWRGLGTAVGRAFVVNGSIFAAYETALRCFINNNGGNGAKGEEFTES
ncbi:hypothetical protein Sjap_011376 [Stephania japonica]|uniref:Mitochondrial arginine transporter BAC2 n=1 Tax=Stephania japonica TaxID=461633 RepID=A0AAP0JBA0_9MAGN